MFSYVVATKPEISFTRYSYMNQQVQAYCRELQNGQRPGISILPPRLRQGVDNLCVSAGDFILDCVDTMAKLFNAQAEMFDMGRAAIILTREIGGESIKIIISFVDEHKERNTIRSYFKLFCQERVVMGDIEEKIKTLPDYLVFIFSAIYEFAERLVPVIIKESTSYPNYDIQASVRAMHQMSKFKDALEKNQYALLDVDRTQLPPCADIALSLKQIRDTCFKNTRLIKKRIAGKREQGIHVTGYVGERFTLDIRISWMNDPFTPFLDMFFWLRGDEYVCAFGTREEARTHNLALEQLAPLFTANTIAILKVFDDLVSKLSFVPTDVTE